jgi:hypothetical protein
VAQVVLAEHLLVAQVVQVALEEQQQVVIN